MRKYADKYRIDTTRLPNWDYSSAGWYFVTICTKGQKPFFGQIADSKMHLSSAGKIAASEWVKTSIVRGNIGLDQWVIMPNHIHGIIVIKESVKPPGLNISESGMKKDSLGSVICQFKSVCTKRIRKAGFAHFAWQHRYFDHVIRNESSLERIREYISCNVVKWELEKEYPANIFI